MVTMTLGVELLPFQKEAIEKLGGLPYAFIGDEMGTGKTITCLALDFQHRSGDPTISSKPTLIVCEKTGLGVWRYHLKLIGVPDSLVSIIDTTSPKTRETFEADLSARSKLYYVVTYDTMGKSPILLHKERRKRMSFAHVISDETHLIKNPKAGRSRNLKKLVTKYRTAATGTPCDDKPWDIWSILNWLDSTRWNSYWDFLAEYAELSKAYGRQGEYHVIEGVKPGAPDRIRDQIAPFFVRRRLSDVHDMPELLHVQPPIRVSLHPVQRRQYAEISKGIAKIDDEYMFASEVITRLQRQAMSSLGTLYVKGSRVNKYGVEETVYGITAPSAKLDALKEFVSTHPDPAVVFTCYKDMSALIEKELTHAGISCVRLDGNVSSALERDRAVELFQSGKAQVFVGTVAAAGKAITLTAGRHVLFTDRHWNPSKNDQASRRAWRIGQRNAVRIYDIEAEGTRDSWKSDRIDDKAELIDEFLSGLNSSQRAIVLQEIDKGMDVDTD